MAKKDLYRQIDREDRQTELEEKIIEFWENNQIFQKVLKKGEKDPRFVFYEGPPTANGLPGVHHVLSRTLKDAVCRYNTMKGFLVERKAGWDTHGLPVEIDVEKELDLESKKDIEEHGVGDFNKSCKASVFKYVNEWEEMTSRIGYWLDLSDPYVTCDSNYLESVWWILAQFYNRGFMYRGHKILPYCPRCGTGLSDHEVAQGYREVEDPSVTVMLKLAGSENSYFLVWTTTPWTLLSNVAVAVHPDSTYVKVKYQGKFIWLAEARIESIFGEDRPEIIEKVKGVDLKGLKYEPLFDFAKPDKEAWFAIVADYVTMDEGTGIVHIAPAFGKEDYEEGQKNDLPMVQLVLADGTIAEGCRDFSGMFFKDADPLIIEDLDKRELLFRQAKVVHSYPFCWRCDSPLINYARGSWYIRTTSFKDDMLKENENITWYPPEIGSGRFGEWLKNNIDWAISRERYWGTPLPLWICEECENVVAVDSRETLKKMSFEGYQEDMDLHKPFIDEVTLKCPKCSGVMKRVPDVIDCWFDSGSMPFAQVHYPFENKDDFEPNHFPSEFICEGLDQTRGWFYTLLAISTFITGKSSYKRCLVNGLVLDKNGQKMSKSKGNAVKPMKVIEQFGADPLRWYLVTSSSPWLPTKFDTEAIGEISRIFFDTLKNIYNFFALYANIDNWKPYMDEGEKDISDLWLDSRLKQLVNKVGAYLDDYNLTHATRDISEFVIDDLSNWYVRINRKRYWAGGMKPDKLAAYSTLYNTLKEISKLLAPFVPMTADLLWRGLIDDDSSQPESVHLTNFSKYDQDSIDKDLHKQMKLAENIVSMGRNARQIAGIKVRQPLSRLLIFSEKDIDLPNWAVELIQKELNIKELKKVEREKLFEYSAKPKFKTLGPRFGKRMKELAEIVQALSSKAIKDSLEEGKLRFIMDGEEISLSVEDDLIISTSGAEGLEVTEDEDLTVAIDTKLNDELIREGLARELVNRIQNTRKNADFEVTDRILLGIESSDSIAKVIEIHNNSIKREVLANDIILGKLDDADFSEKWDINGHETFIYVNKNN